MMVMVRWKGRLGGWIAESPVGRESMGWMGRMVVMGPFVEVVHLDCVLGGH